jgi:hypothetical protein
VELFSIKQEEEWSSFKKHRRKITQEKEWSSS